MLHARELARTAGLLFVRVVDVDLLGQRFAIGHLRRADVGVDLVGAAKDVDLDVEMEFAHALQDGLAGFLIDADAEGRVFLRETREGDAHLFLVGLRLRFDRDFDDGFREFHLFKDDRMLRIAQRVAGARFLQRRQGDDVAGDRLP